MGLWAGVRVGVRVRVRARARPRPRAGARPRARVREVAWRGQCAWAALRFIRISAIEIEGLGVRALLVRVRG